MMIIPDKMMISAVYLKIFDLHRTSIFKMDHYYILL